MTDWHIFNWLILGVYLIFLAGLGFFFSKTNKTSADYFVGNHAIPAWAASLSLYATALSSISFVATTSNIYHIGWVFAFGLFGQIPLIIFVAYFFVPFARRLNAVTAYQYLEARFDRRLRLIASAVFIVFHIMRIAIVIFIPVLAVKETLPHVNPLILTFLIGMLCVAYTSAGGFKAVIWTDVFQTLILFGGAFLIIVIGLKAVPTGVNIFSILAADNKILPEETLKWDTKTTTIWGLMLGGFFGSIYQWIGSQDMTQRYSATKSLKETRKTVLMNVPLTLISFLMFIGMGSAIYLFYKFSMHPIPTLNNPNAIVPFFVVNHIPIGLSGLVIAGIFAAAQSTVSSSLNSIATCAVVDFIMPLNPKITEKQQIILAQIISWGTGVAGTLVAMHFVISGPGDMYTLFNGIIGLLGGPIAGVFLLGIFVKRVNYQAAWIGFLVSALLSLYVSNPAGILSLIPGYTKPEIFPFLFALVMIAACIIPAYIASFFLPAPEEKKISGLIYESLSDLSDIQ